MRKGFLGFALICGLPVQALAMVGAVAPAPDLASQLLMVLTRTAGSAGFCTGTVLSRTKILTAAHCMGAPENMRIHYRDGQNALVLLEVKSVAIHPDFHAQAPKTREKSIDLAIVTLTKPLPDRFEPADLTQPPRVDLGDTLTLAGFGITREGQSASSGNLLKGERIRTASALAPGIPAGPCFFRAHWSALSPGQKALPPRIAASSHKPSALIAK
eukprot:gene13987-14104_t